MSARLAWPDDGLPATGERSATGPATWPTSACQRDLLLTAGLDPAIGEDIAHGRRPAKMSEDEAIVYDFSHELHETHGVSDATYKRAVDRFGERGVLDLIAVNGYYGLVSMVLNVDRTPLPEGAKPLPELKK